MHFLGESISLSVCSFLFALIIAEGLFEALREFFGIEISMARRDYLFVIPGGTLLSLIIGFVSGLYPAFLAAGFQPIKVLRGQLQTGRTGMTMRKILVALQFCITIALIAATIVVSQQLHFISHKDLGFNKERIIVLPMIREGADVRYSLLRDKLLQNPYVAGVSGGSARLDGDNGSVPMFPEGSSEDERIPVDIYGVKYDFFKLLSIEVVEGRVFSESFPTDQREAIVINRSAAELLGWDNPIGKKLRIANLVDGRIIGVVENFHFASLHNEIKPLAIYMKEFIENVFVKIKPGDGKTILASIESDWKEVAPDLPFSFTFLDEHISQLYQNERQFSKLITFFSLLAVAIALLGLYGLMAYVTQQRVKEIGIRKLLGASVAGVVTLLSKDFVKLVLLANLLAWSIVWFAMNRWLQDFAYRISIEWWVFILAGGLALVIALVTVSTQAIRAALANPVEALRYE